MPEALVMAEMLLEENRKSQQKEAVSLSAKDHQAGLILQVEFLLRWLRLVHIVHTASPGPLDCSFLIRARAMKTIKNASRFVWTMVTVYCPQ